MILYQGKLSYLVERMLNLGFVAVSVVLFVASLCQHNKNTTSCSSSLFECLNSLQQRNLKQTFQRTVLVLVGRCTLMSRCFCLASYGGVRSCTGAVFPPFKRLKSTNPRRELKWLKQFMRCTRAATERLFTFKLLYLRHHRLTSVVKYCTYCKRIQFLNQGSILSCVLASCHLRLVLVQDPE